jgi:hypothetical protein
VLISNDVEIFCFVLKQCRWLAKETLSSPEFKKDPRSSLISTSLPVRGRTVQASARAALTLKKALGSLPVAAVLLAVVEVDKDLVLLVASVPTPTLVVFGASFFLPSVP